MLFKHALNILVNKYNLIFKSVLYFFVIILIVSSIALAFIHPLFSEVRSAVKETRIVETFKEGTKQFLRGDEQYHTTFETLTNDWVKVLKAFEGFNFAVSIVIVVVFLLITAFLFYVSFYSYTDIINEYMSSNAKYGLISNIIANLGKSCLYSLLFLAISIPFNSAIFALAYFIWYGISTSVSFLFATPVTVIFLMFAFAIKSTLLACWLPSVVHDKKSVIEGLRNSYKEVKGVFGESVLLFVMINFFSLIWVILCAVATFGAGFIIAVPTVVIFNKCAELVLYYNVKNYKYYIEKDMVVQGGF